MATENRGDQNYTAVQIAQLKALGFSDDPAKNPRRLVASVSGKEKTGKTHIGLGAPPPILLLDIDIGTEGVVSKFQNDDKQIFIYTVRVPKGKTQDVYTGMWRDVKERIKAVCVMNKGTLVMDTATEIYELARLARFGKLAQVMPHHYQEVNSEWRKEVIADIYESDMNAILLHKVKPKYINNVRTNEYDVSGFGETGYLVQVNATASRERHSDGKIEFYLTVDDCRPNPNIEGTVLRGPMCNFGFLLDLVHSK